MNAPVACFSLVRKDGNQHLEAKNEGLEDDFPFQTGDFPGSMSILQRVIEDVFISPWLVVKDMGDGI